MTTEDNIRTNPRLYKWLNIAAFVFIELFLLGLAFAMIAVGEYHVIAFLIFGGLWGAITVAVLFFAFFVEKE